MTSKDIWPTLSNKQKEQYVMEAVQSLLIIEKGKHPLSGRRGQGKLSSVKTDLERFILNTADWESQNSQTGKR